MTTNTNTPTSVDQFLQTLKQQIALTCKIHHCKFEDIPEPLWNITLGAACDQENIHFKRSQPGVHKSV